MTETITNAWKAEARTMKRRDLTTDELRALDEEILKGTLKPDMDRRKRKNAIRTALDHVERSPKR